MLASGTRLGPYEILALVGEGGMGQVFKARNISRLEHPHICPLYDVGEHEGRAYLVMQFLEGETMAERLQRGPLTIAQTLDYGMNRARLGWIAASK